MQEYEFYMTAFLHTIIICTYTQIKELRTTKKIIYSDIGFVALIGERGVQCEATKNIGS